MIIQSNNHLPLQDKSMVTKRIKKEHGNNLKPGIVLVTEDQLRKSGLRGYKLYCLYLVVCFLVISATANIIITVYILRTIGMGSDGLQSLQFSSNGKLLTFKRQTEINDILLITNTLADSGNGLDLTGTDRSTVSLKTENADGSRLTVSEEDVTVSNVKTLRVIDPTTGKSIFSTELGNFKFPSKISSIKAEKIQATKVTSPRDSDLGIITADTGKLYMTGNTDINLEGESVSLSSRHLLHLLSDQSLVLSSKAGIYLRDVFNLAKVPPNIANVPERRAVTYRLCVCASNGRLFQVADEVRCDRTANTTDHLCLK